MGNVLKALLGKARRFPVNSCRCAPPRTIGKHDDRERNVMATRRIHRVKDRVLSIHEFQRLRTHTGKTNVYDETMVINYCNRVRRQGRSGAKSKLWRLRQAPKAT